MTELTTTVQPSARTVARPAAATDQPTLITEQQVLFATAAVVAAPPLRRPWLGTMRGAVRALLVGPQTPTRRHSPRRYTYLEQTLMAREMNRL